MKNVKELEVRALKLFLMLLLTLLQIWLNNVVNVLCTDLDTGCLLPAEQVEGR